MSSHRAIMLSGWAHGPATLESLGKALDLDDLSITSPVDLLASNVQKENMSAYAAALDNQIDSTPTVLIGWSMGAIIALETASVNPTHITGLVLVSGTASFCTRHDYSNGTDRKVVRGMRLGLKNEAEDVLESFYKMAAEPGTVDPEESADLLNNAIESGISALAHGLEYLEKTDLRDRLGLVRIPVLLAHGNADTIIPASAGEYLNGHLADCRIKVYEGAGHKPFIPYRDQIADEIKSFIRELT